MPPVAAGAMTVPSLWSTDIGDHVIAARFSFDGRWLAAASVDGHVQVFEAGTGRIAATFKAHDFGAAAIGWQPRGDLLASAGQDGRVRLWRVDASDPVAELDAGAEWAERLAWSPKGEFLATAAGRKLRLWSAKGDLLREYAAHPSTITEVAWRPSSNELLSTAYGVLWIWRPDRDEPLRSFSWKGSILAAAWSPDGHLIATGNQDASVHFWIVARGEDLHMSGYATKVRALAWSPDSRRLATGGAAEVVIWDCGGKGPAGSRPAMLGFHEQPVSQLAWQRKGPLLASGCGTGQLALWLPARSDSATTARRFEAGISQLAWSPDDAILAVGTATGGVMACAVPGRQR